MKQITRFFLEDKGPTLRASLEIFPFLVVIFNQKSPSKIWEER